MLERKEPQSYVEAVESQVEAVFRSREYFSLPGAEGPTLPVQAFVCGIRQDEGFQVFLALHSKSIKRNLVYSVAHEKRGKGGYEVALNFALNACRTLGFAMESVNLKVSNAMREVVIRDIPVVLSPAAAGKAAAKKAEELAELERLTVQPEENEASEEAAVGLSPARRAARERARQERQEAVRAAARKLAAENVADEQLAATRQAVESLLASGFEVTEAPPAPEPPGLPDRPQPPAAVDAEAAVAAPATAPTGGDAREMQRLARELDRLRAEKAAAEQRVAELSATALQAAALAEAERAERERLEAAQELTEQRAQELAEAVRQAARRVEAERAEREQLLAEKAAAEQRAAALAEAARLAEKRAVTRLADQEQQELEQAERERVERERLVAEKEAAERRAAELAEAVRRVERQAAAERAERERLLAEKAAVEQRSAELAGAARRAAERAEVERRERERLEAEKARMERRLLAQSEELRKVDAGAAEKAPRAAALPSLGGLFGNEERATESPPPPAGKSSTRPAVSGAFFRVAPELADIVYDSADDVLEVHQSIGMTQLSLEGFPNQYCSAWIVVLKKGEGREVYVAFRLAASHRVLVYLPATPPGDPAAYASTMKEAARFLRVTGIETESLPLGKSPQSRSQALRQVPVLRPAPRHPQQL